MRYRFNPAWLRPLWLALSSALVPGLTAAQTPTERTAPAIQLEVPRGGWIASQRDNSFMQTVNYPASTVSLRAQTSVEAQIRGHIRGLPKPGTSQRPATLIVNGLPMPIETTEDGYFGRPYAFSAGSNSIELRSPNGQSRQRVQFFDHGQTARARLRIVLNWDSPGTDLDLHVISPSGQHCWYGNRIIQGGGALDVDVTTGYGPEIFATAQPERGIWHIYVNYFGGMQSDLTTAQVTIITDEGSPHETQRIQRVPLRASGDLKAVASFAVR